MAHCLGFRLLMSKFYQFLHNKQLVLRRQQFPSSRVEVLSILIGNNKGLKRSSKFPSSHVEVLSIPAPFDGGVTVSDEFPSSHVEVLSIPFKSIPLFF